MGATQLRKENIILIGMPGAGKSTIGVVLAKMMQMDFCDTDLIIQKNTGSALQDIINNDGLAKFLEAEQNAILQLECNNSVIATGGSAVLSSTAVEHMRNLGTVVYLRATLEQIKSRIHNLDTRGIAFENGQTLSDIYKQRIPLYEQYCDITVDCDSFDCAAIAAKIKTAIK